MKRSSSEQQSQFMAEAVRLGHEGMKRGDGGPFGAVIVHDGVIIGRGWNRVLRTNDPTAHAEVNAIREACAQLGNFQLDECELYTSCEPCPMCLGAIYWARPAVVYYANTREDAAAIGFDDKFIYDELALEQGQRTIPMLRMSSPEAVDSFRDFASDPDRRMY